MSGYIVKIPQPHPAHGVSEAGVNQLTRSLTAEWVSHAIRVNSISPGIMNTRLSGGDAQESLRRLWLERSPMGIGDPEDLESAAILLCGDAGKFMTGTDIEIDGENICILFPQISDLPNIRRIYNFLMRKVQPCNPGGGNESDTSVCASPFTINGWSIHQLNSRRVNKAYILSRC